MTVVPRQRMSADEFVVWTGQQPCGRYELVDGEVVAMSPERLGHTRAKYPVWAAFRAGLRDATLSSCEIVGDGLGVRIDPTTLYEPDCLVRCGPPLGDDTIEISDPVIIAEVVSPSTRVLDTGLKLGDYFRLPSLRHYLVVLVERRMLIAHSREADGGIATRIVSGGALALDPPGLALDVESLFPPPS